MQKYTSICLIVEHLDETNSLSQTENKSESAVSEELILLFGLHRHRVISDKTFVLNNRDERKIKQPNSKHGVVFAL